MLEIKLSRPHRINEYALKEVTCSHSLAKRSRNIWSRLTYDLHGPYSDPILVLSAREKGE